MKTFFKCENCLSETAVNGEGNVNLICQSCGCGDIKFDSDVNLSFIPSIAPGNLGEMVLVKKGESFLGYHSSGSLWKLSFPIPKQVVEEPLKLRKKGKADEGIHGKL
jgi:hypothetical protein